MRDRTMLDKRGSPRCPSMIINLLLKLTLALLWLIHLPFRALCWLIGAEDEEPLDRK